MKQAWRLGAPHKGFGKPHHRHAKGKEDEEYLTECVAELEKINPIKGEEAELMAKRQRLQSQEAIIQGLNEAHQALEADKGANEAVYTAVRALEKIADKAEDKIDPFIERLDSARSSLRDIAGDIEMMAHGWGEFDDNIENVDDRIHELRAAARKHNCAVDLLPETLDDMRDALQNIHNDEVLHKKLEANVLHTAAEYNSLATDLTDKRIAAADRLSSAVMRELPDLKLGNAIFRVSVDAAYTNETGHDDIRFLIRTSGSPEGERSCIRW